MSRFEPYKETQDFIYFRTPHGPVRSKKIKAGKCYLCGRTDAEVYPHVVTVCTKCLRKFEPDTPVISIGAWDFCQICGEFHAVVYKINPMLCESCSRKIRSRQWEFDFNKKRWVMRKFPKIFYGSSPYPRRV